MEDIKIPSQSADLSWSAKALPFWWWTWNIFMQKWAHNIAADALLLGAPFTNMDWLYFQQG